MRRRVLHLLPSLAPSFHTNQVALLLSELADEQFEQAIATLRSPCQVPGEFIRRGAVIHDLKQRFAWDPFTWRRLRSLLRRFAPDVVCPWGAEALAWARAVRAPNVIRRADRLPPGVS
ncbi:MAG: hypothetical protein KDA37_14950, partial [Planctomycetales bacterium]|nr:hypothetical protein [Planctomycetales bacterium]